MRFTVQPLAEEDAQRVLSWRYDAPYDVYNHTAGFSPGKYRGLKDHAGVLCGTFSWGKEAQVPAAADIYAAASGLLDFGVALRPDLTGKGLGIPACACALQWLREAFHPAGFRLAVYEWNARARRVYARLGFAPLTLRGGFLLMSLDERPWRDAARPLENGMPVYHGDPAFDRRLFYRKEDCGYDMSVFAMSAHTGTHIDAPAHLGLPGDTESWGFARLCGMAQLLDWRLPRMDGVRASRVLLRTGGRGLTPQEARGLIGAGVITLCVDAVSVGEGETEREVHLLLLRSGVAVIENAALESFAPGWYEMRCLPLRMPGSDGAPARLLLREEAP